MMQERPVRVGRRLSAIVAADVAGYSRLMGLDEAGTVRILREHRVIADAVVAKHGGRIVKTTGDGLLIEFPSIVDAVECAVALQTVMAERNEGVPQDRRMLFRIGINLGDILIEGDDILGDGVNVAARLEGIAEPGGICISSSAYDQVRGKVDVEFADLGQQNLKNIAHPVRAYAVKRNGLGLNKQSGAMPGRIHRIGQQEVCHLWNLVAKETREGDVYFRLLEKLRVVSEALKGQVFNVFWGVFDGNSLKEMLLEAIRYGDQPEVRARLGQKIENALDRDHVISILNREALAPESMSPERLFAVKEEMEKAEARRLQPYFVRSFFMKGFESFGSIYPRVRTASRLQMWTAPHLSGL